jgi:hypothetical protein
MAEPVICGALLSVAQDAVRLAAFLELLFGAGIFRIPIGVKALRELAVSRFQFLVGSLLADTEYFVIISL